MMIIETDGSPVVNLPLHQRTASVPPVAAARMRCWALLVSVALLVGCKPSALAFKGRVTLDGQPLDEALIMFVPLEAGPKKTGASINQGTYEMPQLNGLLPGTYRVEIVDNPPLELAHRPKSELAAALRARRVIPSRYSHNSPLSVEIVDPSSQNFQQLDFELVSNLPQ